MGKFDVGAMLHFTHFDAVQKVKLRPGTIATSPSGGRYPLYYGSTFKRSGCPRDAVIADPNAPPGDEARYLADELGGALDERTYFHGTMMSELESSAEGLRHFPDGRFPNDRLDELAIQAEDHLFAIHAAWRRLNWVGPKERARALNALWWDLKLPLRDELALTLVLYDGYSPAAIAGPNWGDLVLLPRTQSLAERYRSQSAGADDSALFDTTQAAKHALAPLWDQLIGRLGKAKPRVHLPRWPWPPGS